MDRISQLVGNGSISSYWLHPSRLPVEVVVTPANRHQGIGSALLKRLIGRIPAAASQPLKAACWSDGEAGAAFWRKHGVMPIKRTDIGTIDLTSPALVPPPASMLPDEITIYRGDEIAHEDSLWDDIAQLHERVYRANHDWSAVAAIDLATARQIFLDPDDIIPHALLVAIRDGRPFAMASLRSLTDAGSSELGWTCGDRELGEEGRRAADFPVSQ
ncbi:MAG: GNAT family N-acetyltransferase [Chloroflexia bacterium]|nr:GNAT family N-acetyltransferase [Chloroflexia bacterium]